MPWLSRGENPLLVTTPADEAFRPLDKGGCSLVKA